MKIELTITTDYVKHWGLWEAVRELLQNAIDQSRVEGEMEVLVEDDGDLVINTSEGKLDRKSLLLGASTKVDGDIGQFGEGYKLALLVLCRMGYGVVIFTNGEKWSPCIEYSEIFDCDVLCINIEKNEGVDRDGVQFVVQGVGSGVLDGKWLPEAEPNSILKGHDGDVFIEGLFVCHLDDLEEGYNFTSDRLSLDRDRRMVSEFNVSWEVGRIWAETKPAKEQYEAMERGYRYVEYISSVGVNQDALLVEYTKKHHEAVPVSTQTEISDAITGGYKFQLVPDRLRRILRAVGKFILSYRDPPLIRLVKFQEKYGSVLPPEGQEYLADIIKELS